jgi:hypothetical protein
MREDGRGKRWLLAVARRVARWHASSHRQIWVISVIGCLVSVSAVLLTEGWPRQGASAFVVMTLPWIGIGIGQSYDLRRRRNARA